MPQRNQVVRGPRQGQDYSKEIYGVLGERGRGRIVGWADGSRSGREWGLRRRGSRIALELGVVNGLDKAFLPTRGHLRVTG